MWRDGEEDAGERRRHEAVVPIGGRAEVLFGTACAAGVAVARVLSGHVLRDGLGSRSSVQVQTVWR